jgi:hypothetical protein
MKKIIICTMTLILLLLHSSCLTVLQPVVTIQNMITDKRVIGSWQLKNDVITIEKMDESYIYHELNKIKGGDLNDFRAPLHGKDKEDSVFYSKAYAVSFKKNGVDYYMSASLTRIDNNLYMDLLPVLINDPQQPDGTGYELNYDYLPTFTAARLEIKSNESISIQFLNGEYIKEQVKSNRLKISHEQNNLFGTFVITASSNELYKFLQKYGQDDRLYTGGNSVTLTKKG